MTKIFILFAIVIVAACSSPKKPDTQISNTSKDQEKIVPDENMNSQTKETEELPERKKKTSDTQEEFDPNDCTYDQMTQTDEFLKGIDELKNYTWNSSTKTATIILENKDTLLVRRGGCYDFGVDAKFIIRNDKTDYLVWANVYKKILWIAKILEKEFLYDKIKSDLDSNNVTIEQNNKGFEVHFQNEYLKLSNYTIRRDIFKDKTEISLYYYF